MKPSFKKSELSFLISPSHTISSFVKYLKATIENILGHSFEDRFFKAHISLMKDNEHTEDYLYDIDSKMRAFRPFTVSVKNFNVFRHGSHKRTIYLEIVNKTSICEIFETLKGKNISFTPHITIAKNLYITDFTKVWNYLKDLSYSNDFLCDRITVLKRLGHRWIHHTDIPFTDITFNY